MAIAGAVTIAVVLQAAQAVHKQGDNINIIDYCCLYQVCIWCETENSLLYFSQRPNTTRSDQTGRVQLVARYTRTCCNKPPCATWWENKNWWMPRRRERWVLPSSGRIMGQMGHGREHVRMLNERRSLGISSENFESIHLRVHALAMLELEVQ